MYLLYPEFPKQSPQLNLEAKYLELSLKLGLTSHLDHVESLILHVFESGLDAQPSLSDHIGPGPALHIQVMVFPFFSKLSTLQTYSLPSTPRGFPADREWMI